MHIDRILPRSLARGLIPRRPPCRQPVRRCGGFLLAAGLGVAAGVSCASAPLPSPGWQEAPPRFGAVAAARGALRAGAARVSLDAPYAAPMGGYAGASWFRLRELRDPLFARAVVLELGSLRIALVALDRVLVPPALRPLVEARPEVANLKLDGWIVAATHTHTAPGGHLEAWPAELLGIGGFDPLLLDHLAGRTADAITAAAGALAAVEVAAGRAQLEPESAGRVSFNRRDSGRDADPWIDVLRFTAAAAGPAPASPRVIARLVRFAAHPTLIPFYLRRQSGDFPGVLCRELEAGGGGVTLFACGPLADLAAGHRDDSAARGWERRVERIGLRLANEARKLEASLEPAAGPATTLSFASATAQLPPRQPWRVPLAGAAIASHYPVEALVQALRVGDALILSFPGEMSSELGAAIREATLRRTGAREVLLWTLADHYIGYAFSRESLEKGGKSQHLSAYGPELGGLLLDRMTEVAVRCWDATPAQTAGEGQGT